MLVPRRRKDSPFLLLCKDLSLPGFLSVLPLRYVSGCLEEKRKGGWSFRRTASTYNRMWRFWPRLTSLRPTHYGFGFAAERPAGSDRFDFDETRFDTTLENNSGILFNSNRNWTKAFLPKDLGKFHLSKCLRVYMCRACMLSMCS